ncbi:MAG: class I SAM-dependent methyltransferase [Clostridia bacterium]|nr:class I SAM-dependent methyltransferase [Clostridia bacterium]
MNGYSALAEAYDRLNVDVDYKKWADFLEKCFEKHMGKKPELVLDLGCGTGSMTLELARRGYDMTGLDISPDMLSRAYGRAAGEGVTGVLFLEGDMCDFELYGTMGAIVCCLDGVNHITDSEELARCFGLVHNYLDPDGLFIFDVNTPYKFKNVYADNDYVLEEDGAVCVWQNRLSDGGETCDFRLTVFERGSDGRYSRRDGVVSERCYGKEELFGMLLNAGLEVVGFYGNTEMSAPDESTERWHIVAAARK